MTNHYNGVLYSKQLLCGAKLKVYLEAYSEIFYALKNSVRSYLQKVVPDDIRCVQSLEVFKSNLKTIFL